MHAARSESTVRSSRLFPTLRADIADLYPLIFTVSSAQFWTMFWYICPMTPFSESYFESSSTYAALRSLGLALRT